LIDRGKLRRAFIERFAREPRLFNAPGRVNLIGEHTDYNDGFVLPMAIKYETVVAAAPREEDRRIRVYSLNVDEDAEFDLDEPGAGRRGVWLDYVEGVARVLEARGARLKGADLAVFSDVPVGAGLSSSAALEISTGLALLSLACADVDPVALALAGQQAEHEYVGTMCGIMDQFIAALGRTRHALLIDCRTLEATHIPLDTSEFEVVICDTKVKHELTLSDYNIRRAECARGVESLREMLPGIQALRDVSAEELARYEARLPEVIRRRCRHVITENARTLAAAEALRHNRIEEMGELMYRSHQSLRDDYEVSCAELDALVEIARNFHGVIGARMTGGGFGGCAVNLVRRASIEEFREVVAREFTNTMGYAPAIYISAASNGAREIEVMTDDGNF
jgi:galactokinase